MAYREFHDEYYYAAPKITDYPFMQQAMQNAHQLRMQDNELKARKKEGQKKEAEHDLKNISEGASIHPHLNEELDNEYGSLVDRAHGEIKTNGSVSNDTRAEIAKHAQKVESYKKGADAAYNEMQQIGGKLSSNNPAFDNPAYYKDVENVRNTSKSGPEAMQRYGEIAQDPVKYHKGDVVLQNFMKGKNDDASKFIENSSNEDANGQTVVKKSTTKTPFPIFDGEQKANINGQDVTVQHFRAPSSPEEIPQNHVDEYMSLQNGMQGEYERRKVSPKQIKQEIDRANEKIKETNEKEGSNIPPITEENYGKTINQKIAETNARKKLFDMQQVDNIVDNQVKREGGTKPASGSISTFKAVPVGTTNSKVKIRDRAGVVDKRTYHTTGKAVALFDDKGNRLKIDASNFDGINEETGKRFSTTQSVDGNLSSIEPTFGVRYTDKSGRTTTNPIDIGVDKGKSYTDGLLKHFTEKEIEKTLKSHPDAKLEFFPEATASIKARKNDYSELSPQQKVDVEDYKKLKSKDFLDEEETKKLASLATKYEEYTDQNISTNANNIGQVVQYAKQKGFKDVMGLALAEHTPEEKEKMRQTQMILNQRVKDVREKLASGKLVTNPKQTAKPTIHPEIKVSLIDQIKNERPKATPQEWLDEYKKRSK